MRKYVIFVLSAAFWFGMCMSVFFNVLADEFYDVLTDEFYEDFESGKIRERYWQIHRWNAGSEIEVTKIDDDRFNHVLRFSNIQEQSGVALGLLPDWEGIDLSAGETMVQSWLYYDGTACSFTFTDTAVGENENPWRPRAFRFLITEEGVFTIDTNGISSDPFWKEFQFPVERGSWYHYAMVFTPIEDQVFGCSIYVNDELVAEATLDVGEMNTSNVFVYFEAHSGDSPSNGDTMFDEISVYASFVFEVVYPTYGDVVIINNGDEYTNSPYVTLSMSVRDDESGLTFMDMGISNSYDGYYWQPYQPVVDWELSGGDGLKEVYVRFRVWSESPFASYNGPLESTPDSDEIILDTTPPICTMTEPTQEAHLKGVVTITADASDDNGIAKVEFFYDAIMIGEDTTPPYSVDWDTANVNDGVYSLAAKAWDVADNDAISEQFVDVIVENNLPEVYQPPILPGLPENIPPLLLIGPIYDVDEDGVINVLDLISLPYQSFPYTHPQPLDQLYDSVITINHGDKHTNSTDVTVTLRVRDDELGVTYIDMGLSNDGSEYSWQPYYGSTNWKLSGGDGPKMVYAKFKVSDESPFVDRRESHPACDTIILDTTPPTSIITEPTWEAHLKGVVTITADVSDANGIAKVEFFYDAIMIGEDTTPPYSVDWNTATVNDGVYSLTAKAWDAADNTSSSSVTVNVENNRPEAYESSGNLSVPPWDLNEDGVVNIVDLVLVVQHFGEDITAHTEPNPDVNGDGIVNVQDITLVGKHFGESYSSAAPSEDLWSVNSQYLHVLTKIHSVLGTEPSTDLNLIVTKKLIRRLIANVKTGKTAIFQNYPNPFNPDTWIPYHLALDADVAIRIYDAAGKLIRTLNLGHKPAGFYTTKDKAAYWDGRNEAGEPVASGVYFYTIQASDFTATKKMIVAR